MYIKIKTLLQSKKNAGTETFLIGISIGMDFEWSLLGIVGGD